MTQQPSPLVIAQIVTGSIAFSVVVLIVLAHVLTGMDADLPELVLWLLSALAGLLYIVSFVLPPRILRAGLDSLPRDERSPQSVFSAWFPSYIMALALREAPAVIGFVLTFLSLDTSYVIVFGVVSLFLILKEWPREGLFQSLVLR